MKKIVTLIYLFISAVAHSAPPILVDQKTGKYLGNLRPTNTIRTQSATHMGVMDHDTLRTASITLMGNMAAPKAITAQITHTLPTRR